MTVVLSQTEQRENRLKHDLHMLNVKQHDLNMNNVEISNHETSHCATLMVWGLNQPKRMKESTSIYRPKNNQANNKHQCLAA